MIIAAGGGGGGAPSAAAAKRSRRRVARARPVGPPVPLDVDPLVVVAGPEEAGSDEDDALRDTSVDVSGRRPGERVRGVCICGFTPCTHSCCREYGTCSCFVGMSGVATSISSDDVATHAVRRHSGLAC